MLYLHIGLAKTGTTSIQEWCWNNSDLLKSNGYCYPKDIGVHGPAHHILAHYYPGGWIDLTNLPNFDEQCDWPKLLAAVKNSDSNFIVSSERFMGAYYEHGEWVLEDLHNKLKEIDYKIVFYIRPRLEYIKSLYNQQIKTCRFAGSIYQLYNSIAKSRLNYLKSIEVLQKIFGGNRVAVRLMSTDRDIAPEVVEDFLAAIGLSADAISSRSALNHNKSLSHNDLHKVWQRVVSGQEIFKGRHAWQTVVLPSDLSGSEWDEAYHSLSDAQQQIIRENHRQDDIALLQKISSEFDPTLLM